MRLEGIALGKSHGAAENAGMGGIGLSFRYRPIPAFAFDVGEQNVEFVSQRDCFFRRRLGHKWSQCVQTLIRTEVLLRVNSSPRCLDVLLDMVPNLAADDCGKQRPKLHVIVQDNSTIADSIEK